MYEEQKQARLLDVLRKANYDVLPDGKVVDGSNGRMVCGQLNSRGVVEISYGSTPAIYLDGQIRLHRTLSACSLPVEGHGVEVAVDGLRRQRDDIGDLMTNLSLLVSGKPEVAMAS